MKTKSCFVLAIAGVLLHSFLTVSGRMREDDLPDLRRPDILLIVSEDNGPHLSCYGDRNVQTPVLDQLAGEGIRFTNAYVTQAGCSPSPSSILTGLYPHQNGQIGLATHRYTMYRQWPNLPSLLKEAGYRTGIVGKLHVNPETAFPFDFNCNDQAVKGRDVDSIARLAGGFMGTSGEPFFLMVNYPDAHVPYQNQVKGLPRDPLGPDDVTLFPEVGIETVQASESVAGITKRTCCSGLSAANHLIPTPILSKRVGTSFTVL